MFKNAPQNYNLLLPVAPMNQTHPGLKLSLNQSKMLGCFPKVCGYSGFDILKDPNV
jgi:hypothetical protein